MIDPRVKKYIFFGGMGQRHLPPTKRQRRIPTLIEERHYQSAKAWISEYESTYWIARGLQGWLGRNIRTLTTMGIITIFVQIFFFLVQNDYI